MFTYETRSRFVRRLCVWVRLSELHSVYDTETLKMRTFRVVVELEWRSIVRDVHAEFEV